MKKRNLNFLQKPENRERIAEETDSRLVFMNSRGHIYTIGEFTNSEDVSIQNRFRIICKCKTKRQVKYSDRPRLEYFKSS